MKRLAVFIVFVAVGAGACYGSYRWWTAWMRSVARTEARDVYETRNMHKELFLRDLDQRVRKLQKELAAKENEHGE